MLEYVSSHDGCTQVELAQDMQASPASVARSAARIQRAGLLKRAGDKNDRRYNRLSVTEIGLAVAQECQKDIAEVEQRLLMGFSQEECARFGAFPDRMIESPATEELKDKTVFSLIAEETEMNSKGIKEECGHD